jgi:hypothetical protein
LDREVLKIDKDLIIDINKEIEAKRIKWYYEAIHIRKNYW